MNWLRALSLFLVLSVPVLAGDWPQWLGPHRDGSTTETIKPWKGELKVVWRKDVGPGHSSPVIAGGKVYLHARVKDKEEEAVTAYDANTGATVWLDELSAEGVLEPLRHWPAGHARRRGGQDLFVRRHWRPGLFRREQGRRGVEGRYARGVQGAGAVLRAPHARRWSMTAGWLSTWAARGLPWSRSPATRAK